MLRKLLGRLHFRIGAFGKPSSTQVTEPPPWWLTAFETAPTETRFGPAERNELVRLALKLKITAGIAPNYTTLHGYLTCIVIGPARSPSDWLEHLFGRPLPAEVDADHLHVLALIRRLYAHIKQDFLRPNPHLRLPAVDVGQGKPTKTPGPRLLPLSAWCASFLFATELQLKHWDPLGPGDDTLLNMMWTFGSEDGQRDQVETAYRIYREEGHGEHEARRLVDRFLLLPSTHRNMLSELRQNLLDINAHWRHRGRRG